MKQFITLIYINTYHGFCVKMCKGTWVSKKFCTMNTLVTCHEEV